MTAITPVLVVPLALLLIAVGTGAALASDGEQRRGGSARMVAAPAGYADAVAVTKTSMRVVMWIVLAVVVLAIIIGAVALAGGGGGGGGGGVPGY